MIGSGSARRRCRNGGEKGGLGMGLMNPNGLSLVWPLLAQVGLTLVVLFVMGFFRRRALMRK
ncbi:hypothetical protein, partial [Stenotrophomonas maltophilia]|uniref:hypothetical protein n=1 Tax=Stenotrophomonas maltophilia TaxID=40324 RepID=UPI0013D9271A